MCKASDHADANKNVPQGSNSSVVAIRKKRISFEMDPVLLMYEEMTIVDEEDIDTILDNDDGDAYESLLFELFANAPQERSVQGDQEETHRSQ